MIESGHTFEALRGYTLGQLGIFYREALELEHNRGTRDIKDGWLANHLTQDGLNTLIRERGWKRPGQKKNTVPPDVAIKEAKRLKMMLGRLR